jgi:flagellar transcriptional activator FlhC
MRSKSLLTEVKQIDRAITLINLGARLQVLESETDLSYERLLRLYKEVAGKSPSKGQLPFSTDWFMTWQPNIHASLFLNIHEYLNKVSEMDEIDAVIKAYQLYLEQTENPGPGAAAVGDPRLAPGQVHRQRHVDDDQVQQVQWPLRHPPP